VASPLPTSANNQKPAPPYHRASVRYRCPPASVGRVYLTEDLEFLRAFLYNLSTSGIGLLLNKPLDCGLFLTIQLQSPNSKRNYSLAAHVIHSTQQTSGDWLVGCQFVSPLTSADLDDLL
jgi:hypothetical protein